MSDFKLYLQSFITIITMPQAKTKTHKTEIGSYKRAFKSHLLISQFEEATLSGGQHRASSQQYVPMCMVSVASQYLIWGFNLCSLVL